VRRMTGWVITAAMLAACASPVAVPKPPESQPALPSPLRTASPISTPSKDPIPTESPATSPVVGPNEFTVRWKAEDPTGLANVESIVGVARAGDVYVLVARLPFRDDGSSDTAAWWSRDGKAWKLAQEFPPEEQILTLTAGGPGFVVGGFGGGQAAVWTSVDGRAWTSVSDASLSNGVIAQLVSTASGLVGFGWRSDNDAAGIWTSSDGIEWLAATNETGLKVARGLQAVAAYDGRAIAIVRAGEANQQEIWETTGRADWTEVGSLSTKATVEQLAGGQRGWVAIGSNRAWTSTDGRRWSKGVSGPDVASDVIVDDAGFVAVGFVGSLPGETCGDQRPFAGHTWTSSDGRTWKLTPVRTEFKAAMVTRLLAVDRTLLGYGQRLSESEEGMPVGRWAAALPGTTSPVETSDKPTSVRGCGG
jgi:hypothetical protein